MASPLTPPVGVSTVLGVGAALASGVGAVWAAVQGKDFATATAAAVGVLATISTISSRCAQAVAALRHDAAVVAPYIDAVQKTVA